MLVYRQASTDCWELMCLSAGLCQVSWSGVTNPTPRDVIALYVLDTLTKPTPTVDTLSPLRFVWAKTAAGSNVNGAGNVTCGTFGCICKSDA